ncbi:arabinose efflux permease family protein [Halovivax ruber XH-70]|uniref:Arabinose efflux permease family protein n=1 Tax=Halovivax ruber (strain DSM 18193 / JCM 13892 / XH-70) TaxID=797302 RepID=L0IE17_HALRX|nr:MFS transporter [Halovivax ruber]AGB17083.1 arabinose efflux permease family protein [Halovivax ruber XH-70]
MLRSVLQSIRAAFTVDRRVFALAFARLADGIGNSFLIIVIPLYVASDVVGGRTFGLEEAMIIGIVLSLYGLLNSLFQPFTGRLSDSRGARKRFILLGLGGLATTNFLYLFAGSYLSLVVLRALQGVSIAFIVPTSVALVNELATAGDRGGNMGVYNTFRLVGFGAGPVAAGAVVAGGPYDLALGGSTVSVSGFEATFLIATLTALVSLAMVATLITDPEGTKRQAGGTPSVPFTDPRGDNVLNPVITLGIATLFMMIAISIFATLQNTVNARLDQASTWFGLQFSAFVIAQIFLQTPIGRASDRFGRRPFILWGMVILLPTTLVQGFVQTSLAMFAARLGQGVAGAMVFAPSLALAGDLAPEGESGTTLSVLTMAFGFGIALGPLISGFLVGIDFAIPFVFAAGLALVGAALVATQVEETLEENVSTPSAAE